MRIAKKYIQNFYGMLENQIFVRSLEKESVIASVTQVKFNNFTISECKTLEIK